MSARNRSVPWFREPGERYALVVEEYEKQRHESVPIFSGTIRLMAPRHLRDAIAVWPGFPTDEP